MMSLKIFLLPIVALVLFLGYTIYSEDLKIEETKEYNRQVLIYSKARCLYCIKAKALLDKEGILYENVDISWNMGLHKKLVKETGQSTVPYVYIKKNFKKEFIGGYKELEEITKNGKLGDLLQENNN